MAKKVVKKKRTAEEIKTIARKLRAPHKPTGRYSPKTGKRVLTSKQEGIIRGLRSRKGSKLYTMPKQQFRKWFHTKHDFFYPYNIPKKKI